MDFEAKFILLFSYSHQLGQTMNLAKRICESSRSVIALGKAAFYHQMELDRNAAYE